MRKYWIIENGKPVGPFSQSELTVRRDFTAQLPVWCNELPDWTTVGELPELACLLQEQPLQEQPQQEEQVEVEAETTFEAPSQQPEQPRFTEEQRQRNPYINILVAPPDEINGVKRPKSYMGWNIAALLCCCMPVAVAGLIFSSQVSRYWMRGDLDRAVRASEYAQWAFIISFTLGLVTWPFQLLMI